MKEFGHNKGIKYTAIFGINIKSHIQPNNLFSLNVPLKNLIQYSQLPTKMMKFGTEAHYFTKSAVCKRYGLDNQ